MEDAAFYRGLWFGLLMAGVTGTIIGFVCGVIHEAKRGRR